MGSIFSAVWGLALGSWIGLGWLGALLVPILEAGLGHSLADAAVFDEVFFEAAALLVEEVVGLVNEADDDVREDFGRAGVHERAIGLVRFIGRTAQFADVEGFFGVLVPESMVADAEVVLVVEEQFLKAGAGDIDQTQLHLGGGDGGFGAFADVLFSGTGALHHLVNGAVSAPIELFAEAEGEVEDGLRLAEGEQIFVVAALRKETGRVVFVRGLGHDGGRAGF